MNPDPRINSLISSSPLDLYSPGMFTLVEETPASADDFANSSMSRAYNFWRLSLFATMIGMVIYIF